MEGYPSRSRFSHPQNIRRVWRLGKPHDIRQRRAGVSFSAGYGLQHEFDSTLESCVFRRLVIKREKGVYQKGSALAVIAHRRTLADADEFAPNELRAIRRTQNLFSE